MRSSRPRTAAIAGQRVVTAACVVVLATALIGPAAFGEPSPLATFTPTGRPFSAPTPLAALDDPPDARAVDRIPDLAVPEPPAGDVVSPGGILISVRDLIVLFKPTTTVAEANSLLRFLPAEIVGGNPDANSLLIRLTGPSDLGRVLAAQATLLASPPRRRRRDQRSGGAQPEWADARSVTRRWRVGSSGGSSGAGRHKAAQGR